VRNAIPVWKLATLLLLCAAGTALAAGGGGTLKQGDSLPDLVLEGTLSQENQQYLGLAEDERPFTLSEVDAEHMVLVIFSMYCPYCQAEAPNLEALYRRLKQSGHNDEIKVLGIGAGNSQFEVDHYRDKFDLTMPLFADPDYTVHAQVGSVGTPCFILVERNQDGTFTATMVNEGPFEDVETFMDKVVERAGQ
jgi:peroxiredoxin